MWAESSHGGAAAPRRPGHEQDGKGDDQPQCTNVVRSDERLSEVEERPVIGSRCRCRCEVNGVSAVAGRRAAVQGVDRRSGAEGGRDAAPVETDNRGSVERVAEHASDLLREPVLSVEVVHDEETRLGQVRPHVTERFDGEQERLQAEVRRRADQGQ